MLEHKTEATWQGKREPDLELPTRARTLVFS